MHIVHLMANVSSVPYFNWFAEEIHKYPQHKFSFIVMAPAKPKMLKDMEERGCDCYWVEFDDKNRKKTMFLALPKLVKLFKKIKPDAVNTHLFDDSFPGLLAARICGIKIRVITKQDTTYHWRYAPQWVWADKFNNFNATNIVAVCKECEEFVLSKEKADPKKVTLINHGISLPELCNQRQDYKDELLDKYQLRDRIVIGTLSRLIEWKGYRYIIEAAATIVKRHPRVKFVFMGIGEQYDELMGLVKKHNLTEHVVFTGWVDREYVPSFYGIMDIYLHAAAAEPFGFVIAEAMANGTPLVTTKTGAAGDALAHKDTAYFVAEKNHEEIIDGVEWMLSNPARKQDISTKIKALAYNMFDVKDMVKNYLKLYETSTQR